VIVGYLVSRYPAVSHTFIRREVQALRRRGLSIETFSVRTPADSELLSDDDREEKKRTTYILPMRMHALVLSHLALLGRSPLRYLSVLVWAIHHRSPGTLNLLWRIFHFAEAGVLAWELHRRGIEHLHSHFVNSGGEVGLIASRLLGIGWSTTLHGLSDFDNPTLSRLGEKIALARFVVCVSDYGRAQAMRVSAPAHWPRIHVVRCGLDLREYVDKPMLAATNGALRVLCVGRLAPEKGHRGLLLAIRTAIDGGADLHLRLIGDGPERAHLEHEIHSQGLTPHCTLPGARGGQDLVDEYRSADLFVLPSLMEGLPVTLIEAMALGIPVVAPRLAGIPELVEEGAHGWLFTPGRWDELGRILSMAAATPGDLSKTSAACRRRIEALHDADRTSEKLADLFSVVTGS
jgi:glycosyltransferase involved in cell wall biosynthesis